MSREKYHTKRIKGILFMQCCNSIPESSKYWKGYQCSKYEPVNETSLAVLCNSCTMALVPPPEERITQQRDESFPKKWKLMSCFVHSDGRVFFKGEEQKQLRGTMPPTQFSESAPKQKMTAAEKEKMKTTWTLRISELKTALMSETRFTKRKELTRELQSLSKKLGKLL